MRGIVVAIVSGLLSAGCSVFGIRTEPMPAYTVERTIGSGNAAVEVRRYGPRLAAETTVAGDEIDARSKGFQRLAGFIFGKNTKNTGIDMTAPVAQAKASDQSKGESIAMTAPVVQSRTNGGWTIRFIMPAQYTSQTLPRPLDDSVHIVTVPAETVAVLRYSGSIGPDAVREEQGRLMRTVAAAGLHPEGEPFSWFYDPPWTLPPLRRNEAAVVLQAG